MKKLLLSLITSILLISSSQAYETKVNFESKNGGRFILFVNGQKVNYRPANYITLDHLPAGRSNLKVKYFSNGQVCDTYQAINLRGGYETSFSIGANRYGELNIRRTRIIKFYGSHYDDGHGYHGPVRDDYGNKRFNNFLYALDAKRFDNKKLKFALQYIEHNYVNTKQLIKILEGLSFDDTKVDLLLYSYSHVTDPAYFYLAFDELRFQSSIREVKNKLGLNYSSKRRRGRGRGY